MYRILVIDDDVEILKLMKTALEMKNYEVVTCQNVHVPLKLSDFEGFNLILLDIMMSKISGTEICYHIRSKISTPIIFIVSVPAPLILAPIAFKKLAKSTI